MPNVVLIMVDQMRGDCLSCLNHPAAETPWLDHLARNGVTMTRAYSNVPSCIAARAALMTGLMQEHHGRLGYQDRIPWKYETTLGGCFSRGGYQTHVVGKMHVWPQRNRLGFDEVELHDGYLHTTRNANVPHREYFDINDDYLAYLRQYKPDADLNDAGLECNSWLARPFPYEETLHPTNWVVSQSIKFLSRRDPTEPFFLKMSFVRPHSPLDPPQYYYDMYINRDLPEPLHAPWEKEDTEHLGQFANATVGRVRDEAIHRARAAYYGSITHIDAQIGRFIMALTDQGILKDTVILFCSDHGDMLGDFNFLRKCVAYEGSAHVPMIISDMGNNLNLPKGTYCPTLCELMDVMPTLLDMAGLEIPQGLDGKSLLSAARGDAKPVHNHLHGEHAYGDWTSQWILKDSFKYIWYTADGREQLFDLEADPHELNNLAECAAFGDKLAELRALLVADLVGRNDPMAKDGKLVPGIAPRTVLDFLRE